VSDNGTKFQAFFLMFT